ncbi:hypothetical protein FE257_000085 [Aspergillus nanangensis]|uniref:Malonyl-CoA:ACP transacylase (MAT) domain-containing protein n=1 Tax=Aspergillus nanangensis TaxID=2582783 RepID=A0AAD4H0Y1_ASPNN|nr:hypothetical protein FE257_000085 [Aspergillus nanangensis]
MSVVEVEESEERGLCQSPDSAMPSPSPSPSSSPPPSVVDLIFHHANFRLALPIPSGYIPVLEPLRDAFLLSLLSTMPYKFLDSTLELALSFIEFLLDAESTAPSILAAVLYAIDRQFLGDIIDIHSLIYDQTSCPQKRQRWLHVYYQGIEASGARNTDGNDCTRKTGCSAFFHYAKSNRMGIMALFGGQGDANFTCIQELSDLYATYSPMLRPLIRIIDPLLEDLSCLPETRLFYQDRRLSIEKWVVDSDLMPGSHFIASAPVSVPVIGVLSLARYSVMCQVLGLTPGALRNIFDSTTGHSQGLLVSIAIARSGSWESFYDNCRLVVEALFWLGWECHQRAPNSVIQGASVRADIQMAGHNLPSYMLSLRGMDRSKVDSVLTHINKTLKPRARLYLALINSRDNHVVAGPVASLMHLQSYLDRRNCPEVDQSRIPFNQRKPCIQHDFLPISTAFHSPYLQGAAEALKKRLSDKHIRPDTLAIHVYHTGTGRDLGELSPDVNVLDVAFDAITQDLCDWPMTLDSALRPHVRPDPISHMLVFDRGGLAGLLKKMTEGLGIRMIQAADLESRDPEVGTMRDLLSPRLLDTSMGLQTWTQRFRPRLATGLTIGIKTRLTRLLGTPPVIVAGMTPTTAHWDVVSAVMNAGYHAELAGGGYHNAAEMETAIKDLAATISPGRGITCNLIYANPRAMSWQIRLLRKLSHSDVPIDGLTIGAGVPSLDVVADYIRTIKLRHISFKPGSILGIRQVVDIARAHPSFPIILQWTGGRGGGHHSCEDFHVPILATYGLIRQHPNIYLVAGSGFGDSDSIYPYLTGSWSVTRGHASMPFDGVLLGSRMMVAREAHTSPAVRDMIIRTTGVQDSDWQNTYNGAAGGIITVKSEMGEPIHKIATRGVLLWADMDKTVFSLPPGDRVPYLKSHRDSIISRLNEEFSKPWFGRNDRGDSVDLESMTYAQVLRRMAELMYVKHQARWIDSSYVDFAFRFSAQALERLWTNKFREVPAMSRARLVDDPYQFIDRFIETLPATNELLNPEDVSFFLALTKQSGQKPVNFIPALNQDFEFYFKKDSLWQSEDIDAVVDQDVGRVCILHGPVAAQYSNTSEETAKDILDSIVHPLIERMRRELPTTELVSGAASGLITPDSWSSVSPADKDIFTEDMSIPSSMTLSDVPENKSMSGAVVRFERCRTAPAWAQAVINGEMILQGSRCLPNPFRQLVQAYAGVSVQFDTVKSELMIVCEAAEKVASLLRMTSRNGIDIVAEIVPPESPATLQLFYQFDPSSNPVMVREVMTDRNARLKSFYGRLWFGTGSNPETSTSDTFYGVEMTLGLEMIRDLIDAVGPAFPDYRAVFADLDEMPISIGIVIAWGAISRPLVMCGIDGDLLRLVHRSNSFEYYPDTAPLRVGDIVTSQSRVRSVVVEEAGKCITVEAIIIRSSKPVMIVTSTFLFRGSFKDDEDSFDHTNDCKWTLHVSSKLDESILVHRNWFHLYQDTPSLMGRSVHFTIKSRFKHECDGSRTLRVTGTARCQLQGHRWEQVGTIGLECNNCSGNPVSDFLQRRGTSAVGQSTFDTATSINSDSIKVQMPITNRRYAEVSGDFNPIHVSPIFASIAQLPGMLSHGMCTSTITALALEYLVLGGDRGRLRKFSANFTGMVFPLDKLIIEMRHTGMVDGRMKSAIQVIRKEDNQTVLEGEAEVEQPGTAYLFTGQGSQSKGMGMDLYHSSAVAKALWDDIDQQLYKSYGWSVLDIVQNNPETHTIHFGGQRGRKIRDNYLAITTESVGPDGSCVQKPVLYGLTSTSTSYTFTDPRGLLYSTQFAQPAILLFEAAAFAELRARGHVSHHAIYAGHSLGEYGALSALSQDIPVAALAELAFYRGLMMQASVTRNDGGSVTYGMVAVNPARVGKFFNQTSLDRLVRLVATTSQELLEIVNFNVDGEQYVCSGTTTNLFVLGKLMDHIAQASDGASLVQDGLQDIAKPSSQLCALIQNQVDQAQALPGPITLHRGRATIPLQGIDVPFHSSHLRSTVDRFRQCLLKPGFLEGNVDVRELVGRYIPNLMAKPFSLDEAYIREAYELTRSPVLGGILGVE